MKKIIFENIKTLFYALLIAIIIRSFLFQPFYIPSSSMEPNLLVGDRLFVSKYSYGYSKHSFPFSPRIFKNRILKKEPQLGDVIVFKTPADNRTDYIKRVIGMPGDKVQIINSDLYINDIKINKKKIKNLIKGYESIKKISFKEKKSLNILCRGAALRYFLTRLYDYTNTPKSALIKIKDPREYYQKLVIHNNLKTYKDYLN